MNEDTRRRIRIPEIVTNETDEVLDTFVHYHGYYSDSRVVKAIRLPDGIETTKALGYLSANLLLPEELGEILQTLCEIRRRLTSFQESGGLVTPVLEEYASQLRREMEQLSSILSAMTANPVDYEKIVQRHVIREHLLKISLLQKSILVNQLEPLKDKEAKVRLQAAEKGKKSADARRKADPHNVKKKITSMVRKLLKRGHKERSITGIVYRELELDAELLESLNKSGSKLPCLKTVREIVKELLHEEKGK